MFSVGLGGERYTFTHVPRQVACHQWLFASAGTGSCWNKAWQWQFGVVKLFEMCRLVLFMLLSVGRMNGVVTVVHTQMVFVTKELSVLCVAST